MEQEHVMIEMIYEATMDPTLWQQVLIRLVEYTGSQSAIFTAIDQLNPKFNFTFTHNISAATLAAYHDEKIQMIDMQLHAPILKQQGLGEPVVLDWSAYAQRQGQAEYSFYEKCVAPSGIGSAQGILLETGQYRWAVLGIHRAETVPIYQQQETELLKRLSKHFRRALQIHRQLSLVQQENLDLYKLFDALKTGVILLDENACLLYANTQAQRILETCQELSLDHFNRLKAVTPYHVQLEQYLSSARFQDSSSTHHQGIHAGGVLAIQSAQKSQVLMVSVVPFSSVWQNLPNQQQIEQKVAVFLTEPDKHYQLAGDFLKQHYQLSQREVKICQLFVDGYNLEAIAEECTLTLSSVRTYMKYIFAKTECSTQVELFRLLVGLSLDFEHIP
ncbi:MAG TPA: helix-turn-helix transcriptional regulator [Acinetobacter sp.]|nr:helix-turn-helix transcriptional regulator [Acinetobacter sp.]